MLSLKYYYKVNQYKLPRKTLFALTFGHVRSSRKVGRITARYVVNLV